MYASLLTHLDFLIHALLLTFTFLKFLLTRSRAVSEADSVCIIYLHASISSFMNHRISSTYTVPVVLFAECHLSLKLVLLLYALSNMSLITTCWPAATVNQSYFTLQASHAHALQHTHTSAQICFSKNKSQKPFPFLSTAPTSYFHTSLKKQWLVEAEYCPWCHYTVNLSSTHQNI